MFALGKPTSRMLKVDSLHYTGDGGGGGYSWEFLVGVCHPVLQILTIFQTKYSRLQTWPLKSRPVFRPGLNLLFFFSPPKKKKIA